MTRNDILVLVLHAVFLAIWFMDSKAIGWYKMHFKYRKAIKKMEYTTKDLNNYLIHEAAHAQSTEDPSWPVGFEEKISNHQKNFWGMDLPEEWTRKNHPTARNRNPYGKADSFMYVDRDQFKKNNQRRKPRQGLFKSMDQILRSQQNRRRPRD